MLETYVFMTHSERLTVEKMLRKNVNIYYACAVAQLDWRNTFNSKHIMTTGIVHCH